MPLGNWKVLTTDDAVVLVPTGARRRKGVQPIRVPFDRVARVITTEPRGRVRGSFTLLLENGGDVTIFFRKRHRERIRGVHREVWQRLSSMTSG